MMDELNKRDVSPINLAWDCESEPQAKFDLLDPFLDTHTNGESFSNDAIDFAHGPKVGEEKEQPLAKPGAISWDNRKRSSGSQLSDPGGGGLAITRRKKNPKGMPKRAQSAYHLFFQAERSKILELTNGEEIGFEGLGKIIGQRWDQLSEASRRVFEEQAERDLTRYKEEMEVYNKQKKERPDELKQPGGGVTNGKFRNPLLEGKERLMKTECANLSHQDDRAKTLTPGSSARIQQMHETTGLPSLNASCPTPKLSANFPAMSSQIPYQHGFNERVVMPQYLSMPPLPSQQCTESLMQSGAFQMPPGMEIVLADRNGIDRKYKVQYKCYSMSREAAQQYLNSVSPGSSRSSIPIQPTMPLQQQQQQQAQMQNQMNLNRGFPFG